MFALVAVVVEVVWDKDDGAAADAERVEAGVNLWHANIMVPRKYHRRG